MRDRADLEGAAARAGLTIRQIETLPDGTIASRMVFDDPWAAARLLAELTEQDAGDPIVREWAFAILQATAAKLGESFTGPTLSPELLDEFVRAVHFNVIRQIKFRHEPVETFQAARLTLALGAGDCDDHARLLVATLKAAGVQAELFFFDEDDQPSHVVPLVHDSQAWQWAETTINARFGEMPLDALERLRASGAALDRNPFEPEAGTTSAIGAWGVVTSGDVKARKDELNAVVMSIENDVIACLTKIPPATVDGWNAFLAAWDGFYQDPPDWTNAGAQGRQAAEYTDRIADWQTTLSESCKLSTPTIPKDDSGGQVFSAIKVIAVAASIAAGAWIVHDVVKIVPRRAGGRA